MTNNDPRNTPQPTQAEIDEEGRMGYRDTPGNEGPAADLPSHVKKIPPQDRPHPPGLDLDPAGPGSHQGNANDLGGSSDPVDGEVNSTTIGSREGQRSRSSFGSSSGTMPDTEARDAATQTSAPTEDFGGAGQDKDRT
ncbi:MAG TPA: hypothetical protein VFL82_09000 [Thermomicrobiales bacterium]|nr:hypothetical protein [Thermomicrobiales bacterium]